jgi:hypothetical protein
VRGLGCPSLHTCDQNAEKVVPKFVEKKKYAYPFALDTGEKPAWLSFYIAAIPGMFLIDEQGQCVKEWKGDINTEEVLAAVENVFAEAAKTD